MGRQRRTGAFTPDDRITRKRELHDGSRHPSEKHRGRRVRTATRGCRLCDQDNSNEGTLDKPAQFRPDVGHPLMSADPKIQRPATSKDGSRVAPLGTAAICNRTMDRTWPGFVASVE